MDVKKYEPSLWRDYFSNWDKWLMALIALLVVFSGYCIYEQGVSTFDWASAILGMIPVIPVVGIWWMEKKKKWTEALPTYLNVTLKDPKKTVADFKYIPIQNNIDIRAQAQTVLGQIGAKGRVDSLETFIRPNKLKENEVYRDVSKEINCGKPFELKTVTLFMTKPSVKTKPEKDQCKPDNNSETDCSVYVPDGKLWYWCPVDNENNQLRPYLIQQSELHAPSEPTEQSLQQAPCRVSEDNILKYLPRRSYPLFKFYQQKDRWFN